MQPSSGTRRPKRPTQQGAAARGVGVWGSVRAWGTRWLPPKDFHTRVTRVLQDGETVQVGDLAVRVFAIPGHTGGSAAYLARSVLFLGDSADANKSGELVPAKWPFTDDPEQNRASLKALAERVKPEQLKHLVFAHTGVLDTDAALQAFAAK